MDLNLAPEDEAFREEVRAFLDENLTDEIKARGSLLTSVYVEKDLNLIWSKKLAEKGYPDASLEDVLSFALFPEVALKFFAANAAPDGLRNETQTLALGNQYAAFRSLEGNPHGSAHTSFGGSISSIPTAAKDPLFFLLHCNVDRLWAKWQWLNRRFDVTDIDAYRFRGIARGDYVVKLNDRRIIDAADKQMDAAISSLAGGIVSGAMQILGGAGYVTEHPVERWHRDSKIYDIFEGTEQIQQLVISRAVSGMRIE